MDIALPGKHTRVLYDAFKQREASYLRNYEQAWHGLTDFYIGLEQQNRTNVPATKQGNRQTLPLSMHEVDHPPSANSTANRQEEAIYPSTSEERRHPTQVD